jgi:hypothetical protein
LSDITVFTLAVAFNVAPFLLAPRLIIGVREFYSQIVGEHIDTGFGLRSQCISTSHGIVFASPDEREGDGCAVEDVADVVLENSGPAA